MRSGSFGPHHGSPVPHQNCRVKRLTMPGGWSQKLVDRQRGQGCWRHHSCLHHCLPVDRHFPLLSLSSSVWSNGVTRATQSRGGTGEVGLGEHHTTPHVLHHGVSAGAPKAGRSWLSHRGCAAVPRRCSSPVASSLPSGTSCLRKGTCAGNTYWHRGSVPTYTLVVGPMYKSARASHRQGQEISGVRVSALQHFPPEPPSVALQYHAHPPGSCPQVEEGAFVKENFDELCWTLTAKKNYKPDRNGNSVVSHQDAFKLWCLFNFLSEDKYPLVMVPDEVGPASSPPIPILPGLCVLAEPRLGMIHPAIASCHVPPHPERRGAPGCERGRATGGRRGLSALGNPRYAHGHPRCPGRGG